MPSGTRASPLPRLLRRPPGEATPSLTKASSTTSLAAASSTTPVGRSPGAAQRPGALSRRALEPKATSFAWTVVLERSSPRARGIASRPDPGTLFRNPFQRESVEKWAPNENNKQKHRGMASLDVRCRVHPSVICQQWERSVGLFFEARVK